MANFLLSWLAPHWQFKTKLYLTQFPLLHHWVFGFHRQFSINHPILASPVDASLFLWQHLSLYSHIPRQSIASNILNVFVLQWFHGLLFAETDEKCAIWFRLVLLVQIVQEKGRAANYMDVNLDLSTAVLPSQILQRDGKVWNIKVKSKAYNTPKEWPWVYYTKIYPRTTTRFIQLKLHYQQTPYQC